MIDIDELPEKIAIYTNPLWWMYVLVLVIIYGAIELWNKVIWCNKRWYYNKYDYYMFKREFDKGLTYDQIRNVKFWLTHKKKTPNYSKIKALIDSLDVNNYKNE